MRTNYSHTWIFVFFQNTALNLAAIAGNAPIVTYLLSVKDQEILMNSYNQNVLDLAVEATKEDVAMAIAEHDRYSNPLSPKHEK